MHFNTQFREIFNKRKELREGTDLPATSALAGAPTILIATFFLLLILHHLQGPKLLLIQA
jgi:hypothetical protein